MPQLPVRGEVVVGSEPKLWISDIGPLDVVICPERAAGWGPRALGQNMICVSVLSIQMVSGWHLLSSKAFFLDMTISRFFVLN